MAKAKVLSKDEIKRVLRIAELSNNGLRDKVAIALSIMAGMRVGEIAALTLGDVRGLDGKCVEIINLSRHQTKGNRSRRVFVSDELRKLINSYLDGQAGLDGGRALVRSSRTGGAFQQRVAQLAHQGHLRSCGDQNQLTLWTQDVRNALERCWHRYAHNTDCSRPFVDSNDGSLLRCK